MNNHDFNITNKRKAFTLAEVLITLTIIGIVAALTIPTLIANKQELENKVALKNAYADLANAFGRAKNDGELASKNADSDVTNCTINWDAIKNNFKIAKDCGIDTDSCWNPSGEKLYSNTYPRNGTEPAFIDTQGRAWARYNIGYNCILTDTNGSKSPNQYGKDRFIFIIETTEGLNYPNTSRGAPVRIIPYGETVATSAYCPSGNCTPKKWLYE